VLSRVRHFAYDIEQPQDNDDYKCYEPVNNP